MFGSLTFIFLILAYINIYKNTYEEPTKNTVFLTHNTEDFKSRTIQERLSLYVVTVYMWRKNTMCLWTDYFYEV